jgi:hypothetical protein
MAVLDIQRRGQQIGRLRIGQLVRTEDGKQRPARLDTFRFTTQSRHGAQAIADLYGGEIKTWNGEFEVITDQSEIGVTVPPRDQVVSQWYEMWNRGGAMRRCDSQVEQLSGKPCMCPHADNPDDLEQVDRAALERARLAKMNPPRACKLVTRISVMIPDLPGLGVFRLDTGSYYAAVEIGDAAAVMQVARDQGVFLPAILRIEHRQRVAGGKTTRYPVPVLEVIPTFREIATGAVAAGGITAQLPPAPGEERRALTAGRRPAATSPAANAAPPPLRAERVEENGPANAQQIADAALKATCRAEVEVLGQQANEQRVDDDLVCTDTATDTWEELKPFLTARWRALPEVAPEPERGDAA